MNEELWPEINTSLNVLSGNMAKIKVLEQLNRLIAERPRLRILDIGCVGPEPLLFWQPLLARHGSRFHLTGIDVEGIDSARELAARQGWSAIVTLRQGNGYFLRELFAPDSFDVVTSIQVLNRVARPRDFMSQVAAVLQPGGLAFFTVDSASPRASFDLRALRQWVKRSIGRSLVGFGREQYHYKRVRDGELTAVCEQAGLAVVDRGYYNLAPLKFINNHVLPADRKNIFLHSWFALEEFLNGDESARIKTKHFFQTLYVHARKAVVVAGIAIIETAEMFCLCVGWAI